MECEAITPLGSVSAFQYFSFLAFQRSIVTRPTSTNIEPSDSDTRLPQWEWALVLLPLAYLWFRLINNLRLEWTTDPQYGYGLLVPFLCLGLLIRRWHGFRGNEDGRWKIEDGRKQRTESKNEFQRFSILAFQLLAFSLAFLYLPTRLLEAAVPEWRPIQWALGIIAIGLTLCAIYVGLGRGWLKQLAFPICFFFVAIPWPTLIETPIIQDLTRASAAIVTELLGWVGVPTLVHGNVIEVSTGMVGIDEACSGIRSFQSSVMISLFFGEFYRLSAGRRWLLISLGFVFSMAFNVCRMSLLTLVAAKKGVAAISEYHDPAGITIAILCTLALWALAVLLRSSKFNVQSSTLGEAESRTMDYGQRTTDHKTFKNAEILKTEILKSEDDKDNRTTGLRDNETTEASGQRSVVSGRWSVVSRLALALLAWLCLVEGGVQLWYRIREAHLKPGPDWTLTLPRDNPTLKDIPMDAATRNLLRFDEAKQAVWTEPDGTQWQAFYF
ncbi:MAG: exosortase/archaeosortase family protein, partial [Verrucomicrobiia bacterium]